MSARRKLFINLAYIVFLLVLVEGSSRLLFKIPVISELVSGDDDVIWRHRWINRHQDGIEIANKFDIYDPTKGWVSKPNLRELKVYKDKLLNTNSKGLRGKIDYSYGQHPNKLRILVLGDSYTFGEEVSDNETYSFYLQEMMPDAEIINMGIHGYGHDQILIFFKEEGIKYQPDIVILGFLATDMPRNLLQFRDFAKPKFELEGETLKLSGSPVPRPEEVLKKDWMRPRIYDVLSLIKHGLINRTGHRRTQMEELTGRILDEIAATAEKIGAVPIFVYLPKGKEITTPKWEEEFFRSYCDEGGKAFCFSSRPYFIEKQKKGLQFKKKGHWGSLGQVTAAEAIYENPVFQKIIASRSREVKTGQN